MIIRARRQFDIGSLKFKFQATQEYRDLNEGQKKLVDAVFAGRNILLSGQAGTGKSFVINALKKFFDTEGVLVGLTAMTGAAAINVGGTTVHSFSGVGTGEEDFAFLSSKAYQNKKSRRRIQNVKILIIDEISMMGSVLFEKLDKVYQSVRANGKLFGGVQLVFSGEFLQLPPVFSEVHDDFCFKSKIWKDLDIKFIELEELIRQSGDLEFGKLLKDLRVGKATDYSLLIDRVGFKFKDKKPAVHIFSKNIDVDRFNLSELKKINQPEFEYHALDLGDPKLGKYFDKNCPAPKLLVLKKGAQVMCLKNLDLDAGICNGSLGVVDGFAANRNPIVNFNNGVQMEMEADEWSVKEQECDELGNFKYKVRGSRRQLPIKLSYAITVHKSQGQTFDRAIIDPAEIFACGQFYVGLSRLRSLDGLSLKSFDPTKIMVHPECAEFYERTRKNV